MTEPDDNYWDTPEGQQEAQQRFIRYFEDLQQPTGEPGEFTEVGLSISADKAELIAVQLQLPSAEYLLRLIGELMRERGGPFERYLLPSRIDTDRGVVDYEGPRQILVMSPSVELVERLYARGVI